MCERSQFDSESCHFFGFEEFSLKLGTKYVSLVLVMFTHNSCHHLVYRPATIEVGKIEEKYRLFYPVQLFSISQSVAREFCAANCNVGLTLSWKSINF